MGGKPGGIAWGVYYTGAWHPSDERGNIVAMDTACEQCGRPVALAMPQAGRPSRCPACQKAGVLPRQPRTPAAASDPQRLALAKHVRAAFHGSIPRKRTTLSYLLGLLLTALVMLLLPLVYLALIGLVAAGVYLHLVYDAFWLETVEPEIIVLYAMPAFAGALVILFLIKPLIAPAARHVGTRSLTRDGEPVLFALVDQLCATLGAPPPRRIDVGSGVTTAVRFQRGAASLLTGDRVLTIGVSLAAGLTMRQFAGALAHELGHCSQGVGMRLDYLIRAINNWLERSVEQRDQWDEWLEETAGDVDIRLGVLLYLTMGLIWLSRRVLWVLMLLGRCVSGMFTREMVYDADRCQASVAGSEVFAATLDRIAALEAASRQAHATLNAFRREGRLGDNLPKLVAAYATSNAAVASTSAAPTGWFDAQPSREARVARVTRSPSPGVFMLEMPAAQLFTDFEQLGRNVTWDLYRWKFGEYFAKSDMHNTDELLERLGQNRQRDEAVEQFCLGFFSPLRQWQLPSAPPAPPKDAKQVLRRLQQVREQLPAAAQRYRPRLQQYAAADAHLCDARQAIELLYAQVSLQKHSFRIPTNSTGVVCQARDEAKLVQTRLNEKLKEFEGLLGQRLHDALELLFVSSVAARIDDAARLRSQAVKCYEALVAISPQLETMTQLRYEHAALGMLSTYVRPRGNSEALIDSIERRMRDVNRLMSEARLELQRTKYPLDHAGEALSIGHYCLGNLPLPHDSREVHRAAGTLIDGYFALYARLAGHLAVTALEVERALGLAPLSTD